LPCHRKRRDRAKKTRPGRNPARNRLDAKISLRPVGDLIPYINNPRTHSDEQVAVIAGSIREFGWTNPVLIDGRNGIIAGHGRVLAARKLGLAQVPCIELAHLTEAQRRAYVIADNQTALRAGWSDELLRLELGQLQAANFDIEPAGLRSRRVGLGARACGRTGAHQSGRRTGGAEESRRDAWGPVGLGEASAAVRRRHVEGGRRAPACRRQAAPDGHRPALWREL
jgi:hypothetical protein